MDTTERLREIASQIADRQRPQAVTVRTFLSWFNAKRRGFRVVREIRAQLSAAGLATVPDFEGAYIDSEISFFEASPPATGQTQHQVDVQAVGVSSSAVVADPTVIVSGAPLLTGGSVDDPTNRIGKLPAANRSPLAVAADNPVELAISLMIMHDFSQLPVMQGDRDVKGIIRWDSLGARLALGGKCEIVRDCMEAHHEVSSETSLFAALPGIIQYQYVLVRAADRRISGIVTTTDLSLQFRQLAEPFLLLGEIENHIRRLIDGKFTIDEVKAAHDTADTEWEVESVADLTFGGYVSLLGSAERWSKLGLAIDRKLFVGELDAVRRIRNDVMHFDPDGVPQEDIAALQRFVGFLQRLQSWKSA